MNHVERLIGTCHVYQDGELTNVQRCKTVFNRDDPSAASDYNTVTLSEAVPYLTLRYLLYLSLQRSIA